MNDDDEDDDLEFGRYEGQCLGCDMYGTLDDLGLCKVCGPKLERDMIRQRHWAYSVSAFGVPPEKFEELRNSVIKKFGSKLELIAPDPAQPKRHRRRSKRGVG